MIEPLAPEISRRGIIDSYNRLINYLRISVTDRCNLRCIYCMPQGYRPKLPRENILRYEEILRIVKAGAGLGISKIRVTGGEPLVRKGIFNFLSLLNEINGISELSLTTNGVLLNENINKILSAGIKRINISLDTLQKRKFKKITGHDYYHQVWEGIIAAYESGMAPLKINTVILKGINDDELLDFAALSFFYPFHIRFIEHMPMGNSCIKSDLHLPNSVIKKQISKLGKMIPVKKKMSAGPARCFKFEGALGEVGFISPLSQSFCGDCNRLRLTANGQLRPCLLSDYQQNIAKEIRSGCSDKKLSEMIIQAIRYKPYSHDLIHDKTPKILSQMSSVGG